MSAVPPGATGATGAPGGGGPPLRRWAVFASVLVVLVGLGLVDAELARPAPAPAPVVVASAASPVGSESSTWYCTGESGSAGGMAQGTLLVANAGPVDVSGAVDVVNNAGTTGSKPLRVPPRSEITVSPSAVTQGDWLAATVRLQGGGVVVSQMVQGPAGWAQSACASTALPDWYFASGSTAPGSTLVLALFNPMAAPAVVDTTFVTPAGRVQPQPDQAVVVAPGQLVAIDVGTYVQDQAQVSSIVSARSGRIVAAQVETQSLNNQQGLSVRVGAAAPRTRWNLARTVDPVPDSGATTELSVLNPGARTETVTVSVQLPPAGSAFAARVAPFVARVAPYSTWHLRTDSASRIPASTDFALSVRSSGRDGVVVDRVVTAPPGGVSPQWGTTPAIGPPAEGAGRWVLPSPGPGVAGAVPSSLTVQNVSGSPVRVRVSALAGGRVRGLGAAGTLRVGPGAFAVIGQPVLAGVAGDPLLVVSSGPLAVLEELSPAGGPGVVAVAGVPLG